MCIYICVFPHDVADPTQETQAHADVLVQDPTHAAEQSQGLADQLVAVFEKPWKQTQNAADEARMYQQLRRGRSFNNQMMGCSQPAERREKIPTWRSSVKDSGGSFTLFFISV